MKRLSITEFLDARTDKSGECWLWTGTRDVYGYGKAKRDGRTLGAHRLVYEHAHGPVPRGLFVCHRCDNRLCVRPEHLFAGTAADNNADMYAKGRGLRGKRLGEANPAAKLSSADVVVIRYLIRRGARQVDIARVFDIAGSQVSHINTGKCWDAKAEGRSP